MNKLLGLFLVLVGLLVVGGAFVAVRAAKAYRHVLALEYDLERLDPAARGQLVEVWRTRLEASEHPWLDIELDDSGARASITIGADDEDPAVVARLRALLERSGKFALRIPATPADLVGGDLEEELARVHAWLDAEPDADLRAYNAELMTRSGPVARLGFYERSGDDPQLAGLSRAERVEPLVQEEDPEWRFGWNDLAQARPTLERGLHAVAFNLLPGRAAAFSAFTAAHVDMPLAIVLDTEIISMPEICDPLPGHCVVQGGSAGFTREDALDLAAILRAGTLPCAPSELVFIDATLSK